MNKICAICLENIEETHKTESHSEIIESLTILIKFVNKTILEELKLLEFTKNSCYESLTIAENNVSNSLEKIRDYQRPVSVKLFGCMIKDKLFNYLVIKHEQDNRNLSDIQKFTTSLMDKHNEKIKNYIEQRETLEYCQELGLRSSLRSGTGLDSCYIKIKKI